MVFIHIIFICGCRFDATVTNLQSMSDNLRKEEMMMLNRIRKNGKRVLVFLIAALLLTMIPAVPLHADTVKDDTTIDFVLVLDCSGTMRDNDPEHWTEAAAKQFVNILGTENVRLAVIAMGHDYGNDAYPVGQSDPQSRNRVKVAFPLTKIGDNEQKKEAKDIIHEVTSDETRGTMTPIGYALQAAYEILDEGEAADGQAAVIVRNGGRFVILAADAAFSPRNWRENITPGFGFDRQQQLKSLRWIAAKAADPGCAAVLCSHDPGVLPHSIEI